MAAVEAVLQVDASLSNQVVPSHQVVVVDQHRQQRLLRELGLYLKGPGRRSRVGKSGVGKPDAKPPASYLPNTGFSCLGM